jgi:hypothetical protein
VTLRPHGSAVGTAKLSETDVPVILATLAAGIRQVDIAAHFGVSQFVISQVKLGRTWRQPDATYSGVIPLCGSTKATAVLRESDIPKIRAALGAGELQRVIAQRYGVSRGAIRKIKIGRTWRHVA